MAQNHLAKHKKKCLIKDQRRKSISTTESSGANMSISSDEGIPNPESIKSFLDKLTAFMGSLAAKTKEMYNGQMLRFLKNLLKEKPAFDLMASLRYNAKKEEQFPSFTHYVDTALKGNSKHTQILFLNSYSQVIKTNSKVTHVKTATVAVH